MTFWLDHEVFVIYNGPIFIGGAVVVVADVVVVSVDVVDVQVDIAFAAWAVPMMEIKNINAKLRKESFLDRLFTITIRLFIQFTGWSYH